MDFEIEFLKHQGRYKGLWLYPPAYALVYHWDLVGEAR